jgi:hypothetical protein
MSPSLHGACPVTNEFRSHVKKGTEVQCNDRWNWEWRAHRSVPKDTGSSHSFVVTRMKSTQSASPFAFGLGTSAISQPYNCTQNRWRAWEAENHLEHSRTSDIVLMNDEASTFPEMERNCSNFVSCWLIPWEKWEVPLELGCLLTTISYASGQLTIIINRDVHLHTWQSRWWSTLERDDEKLNAFIYHSIPRWFVTVFDWLHKCGQ